VPVPGKKNKKYEKVASRFGNTSNYVDQLQREKKKYHSKQQLSKIKNEMRCPQFTKFKQEDLAFDTTRSTPHNDEELLTSEILRQPLSPRDKGSNSTFNLRGDQSSRDAPLSSREKQQFRA